MSTIRRAGTADLDQIARLLVADARERFIARPGLWPLAPDAEDKARAAVRAAIEAEAPAVPQHWLVAEDGGEIVGLTHAILLPVPPIYAGEFGPPGLIMEDCYLHPVAPPDMRRDLLAAAEAELIAAGARILLASSVSGGTWEPDYARSGFSPLTCYFAKSGLSDAVHSADVRAATEHDVSGIVAASAVNRQILYDLKPLFWKPHPDADARFGPWMMRSLGFEDRDMFVAAPAGTVEGYAISQPASALHFPAAHDIAQTGFIDDFFHTALGTPADTDADLSGANALFAAAEAARHGRGDHSIIVVCPAAWHSKATLLEAAGYSKALTWHLKIVE